MINLSTKSKFIVGSFLSKILIFFLGDKKRIITRNGLKYEIDFKEGIDLGIFCGIKNEKNLYKISKYLDTNKKKILVDIGANVGSITLPLAQLFHSSTIISIEPTKYAYSKLKKNLDLNPDIKKRVKLHNIFISNKKKKINYIHSSWNFSSKSYKHKIHQGTLKQTSKKTQSLSELLKRVLVGKRKTAMQQSTLFVYVRPKYESKDPMIFVHCTQKLEKPATIEKIPPFKKFLLDLASLFFFNKK